jgi:hypothetical protein
MRAPRAELQRKARRLVHDLNNCITALDGNLQFLEQFDLPRTTIVEITLDLRNATAAAAGIAVRLATLAAEIE